MEGSRRSPFSLVDLLGALSRSRKFVYINVGVITIGAVIVSLLLPRWYMGSATILPPKNQGLLGLVGASSSTLMRQLTPLRALGTGAQSPDLYNYLAILKSRSVMERVVLHFDLFTRYDVRDSMMDDAIKALSGNVDFKVSEEGTLRVDVADKDPVQAAAMANYFVALLDELNRALNTREARGNRAFIEERVAAILADLRKAEEDLRQYQEKYGFVAIGENAASSVSAVAALYAEKTKKELEVGILKRTVGRDNPLLGSAELQLSELNRKLKQVPQLGMGFLRVYREFMVQQKLYETLLPFLEQAKVEEQRDTPTLLILDSAVPPERAFYPKKTIIVLVFFFLSVVLSISVVMVRERVAIFAKERPGEYERVRDSLRSFRFWRRA